MSVVAQQRHSGFSFSQARSLVRDLQRPNPVIYWSDFLLTITLGYIAFFANIHAARWYSDSVGGLWGVKTALFVVAGLLFMRAAMFIHELAHLPRDSFKAFRITWNVLCGIPFLIPSSVYYPHVDHHRRKSYGTDEDGEYLDLSQRPRLQIVLFLAASFIAPVAGFIRFLLMTPLGWIFPKFQHWLERHASSMVVDLFYVRGDFGPKARRILQLQEAACFALCISLILRGPLLGEGLISPLLLHGYVVAVIIIAINNVRTLGAHRWSNEGLEMTFEEQLLDSVNYPYRPWFSELWGPVGTRYHALHHLFPGIPYHNLPAAHHRLMQDLPGNSIYRKTVKVSLLSEIWKLWQRLGNETSRVDVAAQVDRRAA